MSFWGGGNSGKTGNSKRVFLGPQACPSSSKCLLANYLVNAFFLFCLFVERHIGAVVWLKRIT